MPLLRDMALTSSGAKAVVWTTPLVKITQVGGVRWGGKAGEHANAGGVPTRHTHKWDGLNTRHLLESTHTNTHKHKQTHSARNLLLAVFRVGTPPAAR